MIKYIITLSIFIVPLIILLYYTVGHYVYYEQLLQYTECKLIESTFGLLVVITLTILYFVVISIYHYIVNISHYIRNNKSNKEESIKMNENDNGKQGGGSQDDAEIL